MEEPIFVELHPRACRCGGFALVGPWGSPRPEACFEGKGKPFVRFVLREEEWRRRGSPKSTEAYLESSTGRTASAP